MRSHGEPLLPRLPLANDPGRQACVHPGGLSSCALGLLRHLAESYALACLQLALFLRQRHAHALRLLWLACLYLMSFCVTNRFIYI